jgi:hypothetical protein
MIAWGRLWRVGVFGATVVLSAGQAAAQDDAFKQAMDARDDRQWSEVVRWIREAIAEDPKESDRGVRRGFLRLDRKSYLPYYFLGEAYFQQDNCAAAVAAWGTSQSQGFVDREQDYVGVIQKGFAVCAARGILLPSEYDKPLASADQSIKAATALAARVSQYGTQHLEVWQSQPDWNAAYNRATLGIEQAGRQFESAKRTRLRKEFEAAKDLADSARASLGELERTVTAAVATVGSLSTQGAALKQTIDEVLDTDREIEALDVRLPAPLSRTRQNAQRQIQVAQDRLATGTRNQSAAVIAEGQKAALEAATALTATLAEARTIATKRQADRLQSEVAGGTDTLVAVEASLARLEAVIAQRQAPAATQTAQTLRQETAAARRRFEQASQKEDLQAVQRANRVIGGIQQKIAAELSHFGTATLRDRGVPEPLEKATQLFLEGEFAQVVATLADGSWSAHQRLAIHGHLLRAASQYQLFLRSGERDRVLRERATSAVQEARAHDPAFTPDVRVFGPRFLAFYRAAGQPGSSATSR